MLTAESQFLAKVLHTSYILFGKMDNHLSQIFHHILSIEHLDYFLKELNELFFC
jgi:hypothetical protein